VAGKRAQAKRAKDWSTLSLPRPLPAQRQGEAWFVAIDGQEVRLSNLDKIYWPAEGYTKGDLLAAYYNLAPLLLPHVRDRPLTMRRMPEGIEGPEFYEKQAPAHTPAWVPRAHVVGHGSRGATDFLLAQDAPSLLFVVNLGCIELHPWHSRASSIERPDYAFFDLDPFPPITFDVVRRVARLVQVAVSNLGLDCFARTSGATGMQVYVPLDGSHSYPEARTFVERVCRVIHRSFPQGTTMEWEISKRAGKVFLDYAMVAEGRNIASVYSVRPHPQAPVATPIRWDEMEDDFVPEDFTIATVWDRFAEAGDLFEGMLAAGTPAGQNLGAAMDALGIDRSKLAPPAAAAAPPQEPLKEYARKRKFDVTPEPAGALGAASSTTMFMIHKHHARRLHYDLRLERGGVLVSFAVPKGVPEEPDVRRLAVHVEDHPMEYATFEGRIPEGEYGAGEVRIFDAGTYEPVEWTDRKITIRLHGERIEGEYHLVQTDGKNWLIFRSKRAGAMPRKPSAPTIEPMLATGGGSPFDSPDWFFEIKWDGVRTLAYLDGRTRLVSRRGRVVNDQYPELAETHELLSGINGLVDGEIICLDEKGRPSFEAIQQRFTTSKPGAQLLKSHPVQFIAFDLLWLDGASLMERTLEERAEALERHVVPGKHVIHSVRIRQKGGALFASARERGLEGVIAKRAGSVYKPGIRTKDWLKIKATRTADVVVLGWERGEGSRSKTFGSLLVGGIRSSKLTYAGRVGTGFSEKTLAGLLGRLTELETPDPPAPPPPRSELDPARVRWVRPELVCEIEYLELTSQGRFRAPSYKGLREDKAPEDCLLEP
jgi:bifunctional non-homologous end joining protein LigD